MWLLFTLLYRATIKYAVFFLLLLFYPSNHSKRFCSLKTSGVSFTFKDHVHHEFFCWVKFSLLFRFVFQLGTFAMIFIRAFSDHSLRLCCSRCGFWFVRGVSHFAIFPEALTNALSVWHKCGFFFVLNLARKIATSVLFSSNLNISFMNELYL